MTWFNKTSSRFGALVKEDGKEQKTNQPLLPLCWSQLKAWPLAWWGQVTAHHLFALVFLDAITFEGSVQRPPEKMEDLTCVLRAVPCTSAVMNTAACAHVSVFTERGGAAVAKAHTSCFCLQCGRQEWEVVNKLITSRSHWRSCGCIANHSQ